ncbi:MAG: ATP-dependent DNA helicase RecG [Rickettsiales bacterium]
MRHEILNYLFSPLTVIKGIGSSSSDSMRRLLLPVSGRMSAKSNPFVRDLLFHLPVGIIDRRFTCPLSEVADGVVATFIVTVDNHQPPARTRSRYSRKPYKVTCSNDTGSIILVFFNAKEEYIKQILPVGQQRVISGRTEKFDYQAQMTHPDIITTIDKLEEVKKIEPVYPLTAGLTNKRIRGIVKKSLEHLPELPEWIKSEELSEYGWSGWKNSLTKVHNPENADDIAINSPARARLSYDEMLANQLHLAILRSNRKKQSGEIIKDSGKLTRDLINKLPFSLTRGQEQVIDDISEDMASGNRMGRLLQGDVGSGKTIVALIAMLKVVEQGGQCALMVPTEIIARQHFNTILELLDNVNVRVSLLTGSVKGKERESTLSGLASGGINIIVGTHALFQEKVEFKNLVFIVIDEQHRFGVGQRTALSAKGNSPHILHMTATPIPRSLTMTMYGDMDCSMLREKPAHRKNIVTRVIPLSRYDEIIDRIQAALDKDDKIYWICPLIEDNTQQDSLDISGSDDIAAAKLRYTEFTARFGGVVGLVHGKMKADERNQTMREFAEGKKRILVATTVVEVGVDVRDATIIVIEKAESFGLSQLHQLRGRVGRGDKESYCILLCSDNLAHDAISRLSILRNSDDGFAIAQADLDIRGGGDLTGTRQSGLPRFIFTNLFEQHEFLEKARDDIAEFLAGKDAMNSKRGKNLEILLQLFGYR